VVVCKSADGAACTDGEGWDQGWIVFHDGNNNLVRDVAEPIIERHQPLATGFSLTANGTVSSYISFHPSGAAMTPVGASQTATLTLCRFSPTVASAGRAIMLNAAGRARIKKVVDVADCPPT
jgi:type IV fimbrial biogenesis protein FimT